MSLRRDFLASAYFVSVTPVYPHVTAKTSKIKKNTKNKAEQRNGRREMKEDEKAKEKIDETDVNKQINWCRTVR